VRVVSWNLWWRFGADWPEREHGIVATLERLRPDLVGLQEVWGQEDTTQADQMAARLGMHPAFAPTSIPPPGPGHPGVEMGIAVLSRWPILQVRRHLLPAVHRPEPAALEATIDHPGGPLPFFTACVEWEREFADDHLAQTRSLADLLTAPELDGPQPVILAADLNAAPGTPPVEPLTEVMVDAWAAAGGGRAITLSPANPLAARAADQQLDHRIDYVLVRPPLGGSASVERAFLAGDPVGGVHPSDHYAVVVDLT
jgi:endonuclease/exonuclease/phosphatase family metal-dependent hydrolase